MTELGTVGATEQEIMATSGHQTPDAARGYIRKTDEQRLAAVRKRANSDPKIGRPDGQPMAAPAGYSVIRTCYRSAAASKAQPATFSHGKKIPGISGAFCNPAKLKS